MVEAESFQQGNLSVEKSGIDRPLEFVRAGRETPAFAVYQVKVPTKGIYRVDARYAAAEKLVVTLTLNGRVVKRDICSAATGAWEEHGQRWNRVGVFRMVEGENRLRFASPWSFPNLDKLKLTRLRADSPEAALDIQPLPKELRSPPLPFAEAALTDFARETDGTASSDVSRLLVPLAGSSIASTESKNNFGRYVTLSGKGRLQVPWTEDAVLRFTLLKANRFALTFWDGQQGVALHCYPNRQNAWAAYRTSQPPGETISAGGRLHRLTAGEMALLATDDQRSGRILGGAFDVRHQDGALVLSKGDVRLLTVPLAFVPEQVVIHAQQAMLRDFRVYRGQPAPDESPPTRNIVVQSDRPAQLQWKAELPDGADFERLPEGSVRLVNRNPTRDAWVSVPMLRPGLYEWIVQIERPQQGTGIFLGDDEGQPQVGVEFYRDPKSRRIKFSLNSIQSKPAERPSDPAKSPAAIAGQKQWLRLVAGAGQLKCWTSGDGLHWTKALEPVTRPARNLGHLVLVCRARRNAAAQPSQIELRHLRVSEFDSLNQLASVELRQQATAALRHFVLSDPNDAAAWYARVWEHQPDQVEPRSWQRACALATLRQGASAGLGGALIRRLTHEAVEADAPLNFKLRMLEELATLDDQVSAGNARAFEAAYDSLGEALDRAGKPDAHSVVRRALLTTPLWIQSGSINPLRPQLAQRALLRGVGEADWLRVHRLSEQLRYWNQPAGLSRQWVSGQMPVFHLMQWADGLAARRLPDIEVGDLPAADKSWRHPLMIEIGKEAFNMLAEVDVALGDRSFADACAIISSASGDRRLGLLPDRREDALATSLTTAVRLAMRDYPELQATMLEKFGPVARLRVREAMASGNEALVERATLQYFGTPAAAEAHTWLGDRWMSIGDFTVALRHYRSALSSAAAADRAHLESRLRMAGAMLGRRLGEPMTVPVRFGEEDLTGAEFEKLITEMIRRYRGERAGNAPQAAGTAGPAPAPGSFDVKPLATFDGSVGTSPSDKRDVDWVARQMAVTMHADQMIVSNRFQVSCYDAATANRRWVYSLGDKQGAAHQWPLVPMRPHVSGSAVFVRMLSKTGRPHVCRLELESGKLSWRSDAQLNIYSDPVVLDQRVCVLSIESITNQRTYHLVLVTLDPETGAVLEKQPLVELGANWMEHKVCQVVLAEDRLVALVAGSAICLSATGEVHWARRMIWASGEVNAGWQLQYRQPPLVAGDAAFLAQPGTLGIECVDLETGRLRWKTNTIGLRRLLGVSHSQLYLHTSDGIEALDARTGEFRWHAPQADVLDGYLIGSEGLLIASRQRIGKDRWRPTLLWLTAETGQVRAQCGLPALDGPSAMLGPLVARDGRLWCFAGIADANGRPQPERKLVELVRRDRPVPSLPPEIWSAADPNLAADAADILPGWTVLAGTADARTGRHAEHAGRKEVLITRADQTATRLARRTKIPAGKPRLILEVASDTAAKLDIRVAGQIVHQETIAPKDGTPWRELSIDLSPFARKTAWITIAQEQQAQSPAYLAWKRAELVE